MVAVSLFVLVLRYITDAECKHIQTAAFHRIFTSDKENTTCLAVCGRDIWCSVAHSCLHEASYSIGRCCRTSQQAMIAQDSGTAGEVSTTSIEDPTSSATLDQRHTAAVLYTDVVSTDSVTMTSSVSGTVTRIKNPTAGLKLTSGTSWRKILETGEDGTVVYGNRSNIYSCKGDQTKRKVVLKDKGTAFELQSIYKDRRTTADKIGPHFCGVNKASGRRVYKVTTLCTTGSIEYVTFYKSTYKNWKDCSVKMVWFAFNCPSK